MGHLLVIPKRHVVLWHELEQSEAASLAVLAWEWAAVVVEVLKPDGYNLLMNNGPAAGQDVFHVHLHITPRLHGDTYYTFGGQRHALSDSDATALGARLRDVHTRRP